MRVEGLRCYLHGGKAPQVVAAAVERHVEQQLAGLLEAFDRGPVADPLAELLALAGEALAWKDLLGVRVAALRAEEWRWQGRAGEQLRAEVTLYERSIERLGRLLVDIARLNIDERLARSRALATDLQSALLAEALVTVLERRGLAPVALEEARGELRDEIERRNAALTAGVNR